MVKVTADATGVVYAGYIRGDVDDIGHGVAVDASESAYVTGYTRSTEATFPVTAGPDLSFNGIDNDAFVAKVVSPGPCATSTLAIGTVKGVKQPASLDDVAFIWDPNPDAAGYNIWYVAQRQDIPLANEANQPPATPTLGCADPTPAPGTTCTDSGAVSRGAPTILYYQVHTYCSAGQEGP